MNPSQVIAIKRAVLQDARADLDRLIVSAHQITSTAAQDIEFRKVYGVEMVKRQVKDQASALYGKLLDRTDIELPWDLAQFIHTFVEGDTLSRFEVSTKLGDLLSQAMRSLS